MLLLTAYMDETGHSEDKKLHFAGMAGFVAPFKRWECFALQWQKILDDAGLKEPFHMKEFAQFRGQFEIEWNGPENKQKREEFFGKLIATIQETKATPIGAIVSVEAFRSLTLCQQSAFKDPYYIGFQLCTRGAALEAEGYSPPEKVAMVYSYNEEFGTTMPNEEVRIDQAGRAEQLWYAIKKHTHFGRWMGSYASSSPREIVQLQAADVLAYELFKEFENRIIRPDDKMRYGLQKILEMVDNPLPKIRLFDRKELLRQVKEGQFQCQVGTEEIDKTQMISAMESMERSLRERVKKTK
jgi:hypothetical protein